MTAPGGNKGWCLVLLPLLLLAFILFVMGMQKLLGRPHRHSPVGPIYSHPGTVFVPNRPPVRAESLPATLPALCGAILKCDRDANGQIDDLEMAATRRPRMFVLYVNQIVKGCCKGIGTRPFTLADQEILGQDAAALMAQWGRNQFEAMDGAHTGHWRRWDWLNHVGMLNWNSRFPPETIAWHFFEPGLSPRQFPDTIAAQADRNGNGAIDPTESLEAERLARQKYDLDGDNRLDLLERWDVVSDAFVEDGLFRLCPEADRNGNGWLDADEKEAALAILLPLYDITHDGRLDDGELWLIARDGRVSGNPSTAGLKTVPDRAAVFAQRRQKDGDELQEKRQPIMAWLRTQLEGQINPSLDAAGKETLWAKLVAAHDADHNGVLDQVEAYRLYRQVALREMPSSTIPPPSPWWLTVVMMTEGIPGRDWRPVDPGLFTLVDVDGDGLFSKSDRLALRPVLKEKSKARDLGQCLYAFWPVADKNGDGRLDAEERAAALLLAPERFDADADGRLNDAELGKLIEAGTARLREDAIANWIAKVGRGADCNGNGQFEPAEEQLARTVLMLVVDENQSGTLETWEVDKIILDAGCQDYWDSQNARIAEQLRRYDYDGDGRLNEEERRRADTDLRRQGCQGIVALPQEEE